MVAASLSEAGTKSVEMQAWRTALDPKGQWVPHVIAAMDDRITHLRETGMPDAAGLILASDQDDARAYAKIVRRVTGKAAELILSDDPKASKKIERFATGSARIAVCVRMISEGVDVPRAAVLAWMTSYRTPLFFAQAVGRVVRSRAPHESATVFLPAVRPLLSLAASMEEERNHVMPPPKTEVGDELDLEPLPPKEKDHDGLPQWEALEADARFAHVLHSGTAHTGEGSGPTVVVDAEDEEFLGIPGLLTPAADRGAAGQAGRRAAAARSPQSHRADDGDFMLVEDHPDEDDAGRSWRDAAELRREINRLVSRVAARTSQPHAVVHTQLRAVGARPAVGVRVGRRAPRPPRAPPHDALTRGPSGPHRRGPEIRSVAGPSAGSDSASGRRPRCGGDGDRFGAAAGAELGDDVADVHARRLLADEELRADLPVGAALREQREHLGLARGQDGGGLGQPAPHRAARRRAGRAAPAPRPPSAAAPRPAGRRPRAPPAACSAAPARSPAASSASASRHRDRASS